MSVTSNFCTFCNALATGCSYRPDWANGSYSATILALCTRISPKLPIPKASELGLLSMCKVVKRNVCGYKTSVHIPKPHRMTNPGLFRVKNLPLTPTSPPGMQHLLIHKPPRASCSLKRAVLDHFQESIPRSPLPASLPQLSDLLLSSRSELGCANISLGPSPAPLHPRLHQAPELQPCTGNCSDTDVPFFPFPQNPAFFLTHFATPWVSTPPSPCLALLLNEELQALFLVAGCWSHQNPRWQPLLFPPP